jgi:hypothetical protein
MSLVNDPQETLVGLIVPQTFSQKKKKKKKNTKSTGQFFFF